MKKFTTTTYFLIFALVNIAATLLIRPIEQAAINESFLTYLWKFLSEIISLQNIIMLVLCVVSLKIINGKAKSDNDIFKAFATLSILYNSVYIFYIIFSQSYNATLFGARAGEIVLMFIYFFNTAFLLFKTKYYLVIIADVKELLGINNQKPKTHNESEIVVENTEQTVSDNAESETAVIKEQIIEEPVVKEKTKKETTITSDVLTEIPSDELPE